MIESLLSKQFLQFPFLFEDGYRLSSLTSKSKPESKIDLSELNEIERSIEVEDEDDLDIENLKQQLSKKK